MAIANCIHQCNRCSIKAPGDSTQEGCLPAMTLACQHVPLDVLLDLPPQLQAYFLF
jgi:hypothetical protein